MRAVVLAHAVVLCAVAACAPRARVDGDPPPRERCACEADADHCDAIGDAVPATTDLCQTWSSVEEGRLHLFAEVAADAPLTGVRPAILGWQLDLDGIITPEAQDCGSCAHIFTPSAGDQQALGETVHISFDEWVAIQTRALDDGVHETELPSTVGASCDDLLVSNSLLWLSIPLDRLPTEELFLSVYTYGNVDVSLSPDLASGAALFSRSGGGSPDVDRADFVAPDWSCAAVGQADNPP